MLKILEKLYENKEYDLNQLHSDYQNYKYNNDINAQENINLLVSFEK